MLKKILFIVFVVGLMASCANQTSTKEATQLATSEFTNNAPDMLGEKVSLEGTISHVCKHGGKKMFIGDENVKIVVSEDIAVFDQDLVGSDLIVTGIVREEMVEPVLAEENEMEHAEEGMEAEHMEGEDEDAEHEMIKDTTAAATEECDMEMNKTLYVVEIVDFKVK